MDSDEEKYEGVEDDRKWNSKQRAREDAVDASQQEVDVAGVRHG